MRYSKGLPMIISKLQFINVVVSSSRQLEHSPKTKHSLCALVWDEIAKFRGDHCTRHLVVPSHIPYHHSLLPRPEGKCLCHIIKQLFHPEQDPKHIQETAIGTCWYEHAEDITSSSRATIIGLEESRKMQEFLPCSQDCLRRKGAQCNDYWFQQMAPEARRRRQCEHKHHRSPTIAVLPGLSATKFNTMKTSTQPPEVMNSTTWNIHSTYCQLYNIYTLIHTHIQTFKAS